MTTTSPGLPAAALTFFADLAADNTREHWDRSRELYESAVRQPILALLAVLAPEFGPGRLLRPYRDLRFGADRSPYRTSALALVQPDPARPPLRLRLQADGLVVGGGWPSFAPGQVGRYRAAVLDDDSGPRLASLSTVLRDEGFALAGERLRQAPRGTDPRHPRAWLLRRRGLEAQLDLGAPEWLAGPRCSEAVAAAWRQVVPLLDWLAAHVGPVDARPAASAGLSPAAPAGAVPSAPSR